MDIGDLRGFLGRLRFPEPNGTYRYERERGAYLLAHSRSGTSKRRHAEILQRAARRGTRAGTGLGASGLHEELTPALLRRWNAKALSGNASMKFRVARWAFMWTVIAVALHVFWPALLLGRVVYQGLWWLTPRIGRLQWWPWVVLSAVLLIVAALSGWLAMPTIDMLNHVPFGDVWVSSPARWWWVWQLALFPAVTAGFIVVWGWDGVSRSAVVRPEKNSDGTYRAPAKHERVTVAVLDDPDEWAGVEPDDDAGDEAATVPEDEPQASPFGAAPPRPSTTKDDDPFGDIAFEDDAAAPPPPPTPTPPPPIVMRRKAEPTDGSDNNKEKN